MSDPVERFCRASPCAEFAHELAVAELNDFVKKGKYFVSALTPHFCERAVQDAYTNSIQDISRLYFVMADMKPECSICFTPRYNSFHHGIYVAPKSLWFS
jgi:hypothetical protein